MIATRQCAKQHSTSSLHQLSVPNIRCPSYHQNRPASKLPSYNPPYIDGDINEGDDEVYGSIKVEKKVYIY
jgi:hypothetical protein